MLTEARRSADVDKEVDCTVDSSEGEVDNVTCHEDVVVFSCWARVETPVLFIVKSLL